MKKNISYLIGFLAVGFLTACKDFEPDNVYTDDTFEPAELYDYYIDGHGNEGIVVYVMNSSNASKYAIVLSCDESWEAWGPMGELVCGVDSMKSLVLTSRSFGVVMHQAMKARGINRYPAQAWCDRKNVGEDYPRAGSWRLPTYYEWRLFINRHANINIALEGVGGTLLKDDEKYWMCNEDYKGYIKIKNAESDYDTENRAVISSPSNSSYSNKDRWLKKNKYYVRAIKYIYYER